MIVGKHYILEFETEEILDDVPTSEMNPLQAVKFSNYDGMQAVDAFGKPLELLPEEILFNNIRNEALKHVPLEKLNDVANGELFVKKIVTTKYVVVNKK